MESVFASGQLPKQDEITYWSAAIAGGLSLYIMTFGGVYVFAGLVSGLMLLVGTVFASRLNVQKSEEIPDPAELGNIGIFAAGALGAFIIFTWVLNLIYYTPATQSITITTWFGLFSFDVSAPWSGTYTPGFIFIGFIIPNAEEQFFRGLFGNGAVVFLGPLLGAAAGGAIFAAFHIAVYGMGSLILATILLDGATIIALNVATGRILTGLAAHIGNNVLSFFATGSVLGSVLGPFNFPVSAVVPGIVFSFLIVKQIQRKGRKGESDLI